MFLLVPAHLGYPGQNPESRKTAVCMCVLIALVYLVGGQVALPAL